jgi:hypothetical protein
MARRKSGKGVKAFTFSDEQFSEAVMYVRACFVSMQTNEAAKVVAAAHDVIKGPLAYYKGTFAAWDLCDRAAILLEKFESFEQSVMTQWHASLGPGDTVTIVELLHNIPGNVVISRGTVQSRDGENVDVGFTNSLCEWTEAFFVSDILPDVISDIRNPLTGTIGAEVMAIEELSMWFFERSGLLPNASKTLVKRKTKDSFNVQQVEKHAKRAWRALKKQWTSGKDERSGEVFPSLYWEMGLEGAAAAAEGAVDGAEEEGEGGEEEEGAAEEEGEGGAEEEGEGGAEEEGAADEAGESKRKRKRNRQQESGKSMRRMAHPPSKQSVSRRVRARKSCK